MHFFMFFLITTPCPVLIMVPVLDPVLVPVPDLVSDLDPVPDPDQSSSRSLVPVPSYFWSRPWSRSRHISGPGLGPGPGQNL